jgi:hypothetical protein
MKQYQEQVSIIIIIIIIIIKWIISEKTAAKLTNNILRELECLDVITNASRGQGFMNGSDTVEVNSGV